MFLLLPAPPSLNDYYVVQKRGNFYSKVVSKAGHTYQKTLKMYKDALGIKTCTGDLKITLDCFPYSKNSRDIDNYFKALLDSLQYAGIIENDNLIRWELGRMQLPFREWPCVLLEIKPMEFKPQSLTGRVTEISEPIIGVSIAPKNVRDLLRQQKLWSHCD